MSRYLLYSRLLRPNEMYCLEDCRLSLRRGRRMSYYINQLKNHSLKKAMSAKKRMIVLIDEPFLEHLQSSQ